MSQYLSEAFKRLDALDEDTFAINDNGLEDFIQFQDEDELDTSIDVIDPEATTEEELQDSYLGKVILDCCVCHSKLYKDVEDVVIDGDLANIDEECPFCYTTDGYKVVGQVAEFGDDDSDEDDDDTKDDDEVEDTADESNELDEGVKRTKKGEAEEYEKVTFADVKKGDYVMSHHKDETTKPLKVVKVERKDRGGDRGDGITLYFQGGEIMRGSPNTTCYVFTKADMKTRNRNVKDYNKFVKAGRDYYSRITPKGQGYGVPMGDRYKYETDDDGSYFRNKWSEDTNESVKRTKKGEAEEYKKVTFADVKKGDFVMDHPNDESAKPEKVIKIERDGDDIDLIFRNGNWSGSANSTCFVFTKADMKTRKANAKQYAKGNHDDYDWLSDEDCAYMKRKQQNESIKELGSRHKKRTNPQDESLSESVNNVNVETDDSIVNVSTDESGKVTVSTEPKDAGIPSEEVIAPIEPDVQSEISDNVADGDEIEIDMDEFDEESFDELGEGYLKKVYENVNSFKTSNVSFIGNRLIVEGIIKFNSGKSKKTNFIFESREATKSGKIRFIGENKEIARGKKSFTVTGKVDGTKFLSESLNYNYGVKGANGKAQRLYGTVRRGK